MGRDCPLREVGRQGEGLAGLLDLTPDPDGNRDKFALINVLHVNFYEENLDPRDVERGIRYARALIDAMREAESRL